MFYKIVGVLVFVVFLIKSGSLGCVVIVLIFIVWCSSLCIVCLFFLFMLRFSELMQRLMCVCIILLDIFSVCFWMQLWVVVGWVQVYLRLWCMVFCNLCWVWVGRLCCIRIVLSGSGSLVLFFYYVLRLRSLLRLYLGQVKCDLWMMRFVFIVVLLYLLCCMVGIILL